MKRKNRIWKFLVAFVFCLALTQTPAFGRVCPQTVAAAKKKSGLKKEKGKYYYYKNGKKVKNTWKTIKSGGKSYKYYFGSNGAAYMGKTNKIAVKKIKGKTYGFDKKGRMVKGVYVINYKFYYFNSRGVYSSKITKKLRNAAKYEKSAAALKTLLETYAGSPTEIKNVSGCYGNGVETYYCYQNFAVDYGQTSAGEEVFLDAWATKPLA